MYRYGEETGRAGKGKEFSIKSIWELGMGGLSFFVVASRIFHVLFVSLPLSCLSLVLVRKHFGDVRVFCVIGFCFCYGFCVCWWREMSVRNAVLECLLQRMKTIFDPMV